MISLAKVLFGVMMEDPCFIVLLYF